MKNMSDQIIVRCYAEGQGGNWEAVCLDFDLAVQGKSFDEVRGLMGKSIKMYLGRVSELPAAERRRFMRRRAPLPLRLKFAWHAALGAFRAPRIGDSALAEFNMHCPA